MMKLKQSDGGDTYAENLKFDANDGRWNQDRGFLPRF
jgi:hypothetical protein